MEGHPAGISIKTVNLHKSFQSTKVIKGMNLAITPGEFIAIVGKSGCGKSTLLRLIAGLDQPTSGEILAGTEPLTGIHKDMRMMFQEGRLLPWLTVLNNVGLGLKGDWKEEAHLLLQKVGLADKINEWPAKLSGGQRQRVALARALMSQPRLLLFDEPLGALDALTRIEMQQLIEGIWQEQKFTSLLVTHDVEEAVVMADRVIVIEDGRIAMNTRIDLPRPRDRRNSHFSNLVGDILDRVLGHAPPSSQLRQNVQ
ncbi:ATP-binding cassette domain-containing protein [Alkalihalobacillus oceani]|uniref:ATP-binding cassette domain-containing protein n=1 Tax=Halalkalibacter oceani TaxID=1653776 RepID=A0A9X2DUS3_9BACI|nr:ATP-binding cassette domain-containing protein [Halalkalibacter oceani]MCM3715843.1 ATP-binding cassette domain-containing protein [Halalkalibacter oceani]